jgi:hypothetical protein
VRSIGKNRRGGRGYHRLAGALVIATVSCTALLALPNEARAQDMAGAANAFSRAQKADLSGDHETAAELYELADSLAAAPEALRSALKSRKAAGQLGSAAQHAERLLRRYPNEKRSKDLAEATLEEAKRKLARVEILCRTKPCGLVVDGAAGSAEIADVHVIFLEPGKHALNAAFGAERAAVKSMVLNAGERTTVTFEPPPASAPVTKVVDFGGKSVATNLSAEATSDHAPKNPSRLSPWIFATGAVVTAGLGAVTIWSGLDVVDAHDAYEGNETEQRYQEGLDKERRTNMLIGATVVAGLATGVVAVFTRWSGSPAASALSRARVQAGAAPLHGGAAVTLGGQF